MIIIQGINVFISLNYNVKFKKAFYICNAIPVWFILSFRSYNTGSDTIGYVRGFIDISQHSFLYALNYSRKDEPALFVYFKILSYISNNPTFCLCVTNFIIIGIILYFFYKNSNEPIIAFYLWTCLGGFDFLITGMRQSFAMAICLIAYEFAKNKKIIFFLLFVLLAAQFHKSAYLFLPVYFLNYLKNTKNTFIFWIFLAIIIISCIHIYQPFINDLFNNDTMNYSFVDTQYAGNGFVTVGYYTILTIILFIKRFEIIKDNKDNLLYNTSLVAWLFWIGRSVSRVAERPGMYFMFAFYISISNLLFLKDNSNIFLRIIILIFPLLLFIYRNLNFVYNFVFRF